MGRGQSVSYYKKNLYYFPGDKVTIFFANI